MANFKVIDQLNNRTVLRFQDERGNVYKATTTQTKDCAGCAFDKYILDCVEAPGHCTKGFRSDGRTIIWIKESP